MGIRGRGSVELGLTLNWREATVSKSDMTRKNSTMGGFTVIEMCIVVVLIVLIALLVTVTRPRHADPDLANNCISNLRLIENAKAEWALEHHKQKTDSPAASDIQPYIGGGTAGELPSCPADSNQTFDTSYSVNNVGTKPTCKILPAKHILP